RAPAARPRGRVAPPATSAPLTGVFTILGGLRPELRSRRFTSGTTARHHPPPRFAAALAARADHSRTRHPPGRRPRGTAPHAGGGAPHARPAESRPLAPRHVLVRAAAGRTRLVGPRAGRGAGPRRAARAAAAEQHRTASGRAGRR